MLWTESLYPLKVRMLPNFQCVGIKRQGFEEVIRFRWGLESEALMMGLVPLWEEILENFHSWSFFLFPPLPAVCDIQGGQPSTRDLSVGQHGLEPWSWTSQLPALWEINRCSSHLVCGVLLLQPSLRQNIQEDLPWIWHQLGLFPLMPFWCFNVNMYIYSLFGQNILRLKEENTN